MILPVVFSLYMGVVEVEKMGFLRIRRKLKNKSLGKESQRNLGKVYKIEHLPDCQFRHFSERSLACDAEILALD